MAITDMNVFLASSSYVYILLISSGLANKYSKGLKWDWGQDHDCGDVPPTGQNRLDDIAPSAPASDHGEKNAQVWQRKWLVCHHINEKPIQFYQSRGRLQWSVKHQAVTRPHKHREGKTRNSCLLHQASVHHSKPCCFCQQPLNVSHTKIMFDVINCTQCWCPTTTTFQGTLSELSQASSSQSQTQGQSQSQREGEGHLPFLLLHLALVHLVSVENAR